MPTIKLLGPIKKQLKDKQLENHFELLEEECTLTIEEILNKRNISVTKFYTYYVEGEVVSPDYILKEGETLVVIPILVGG